MTHCISKHFITLRRGRLSLPNRFEGIVSSICFETLMNFSAMLCTSRPAAARLLWKIEKAYSLGIPKKNLAHGESQTEEEYAYGEKYTMFQPNGRSFWT